MSAIRLIALVIVLAIIPRLALVLSSDSLDTPDVRTYLTVADNIRLNFCVSRSDPASAVCAPHWGGNQLPGYPAFIAAAWWLGGRALRTILVAQSLAASLAIGWLTYALLVFTRRRDMAFAAGCLLALSPLEIGYSRLLLTEALAVATTIWVLAELVLSLAAQRLRVLPLGVALAAAIFIRLDAVLLCLLAAGVAFRLHPIGVALRRGMLLAVVVALPLVAWTSRSVTVGLPPYPVLAAAEHDWPAPPGIHRWATTWTESTEQAADFIYPINEGHYSAAKVPSDARITRAQRDRAEALLGALATFDGQPVPADIDNAFSELAAERRDASPFETLVQLPLKRMLFLWSDPYSSFGWPLGFPTHQSVALARAIDHDGFAGLLATALQYPIQAAGKVLIDLYRAALLGAFLLLVIKSAQEPLRPLRPIFVIVGAYVVLRTVFFSAWIVETRYVVEAIPGLEIACALGVIAWLVPRVAWSREPL